MRPFGLFALVACSTNTTIVDDRAPPGTFAHPDVCPDPLPAAWIFCDDFEHGDALPDRYFDVEDELLAYDDTVSASGERSVRADWDLGEIVGGDMKVAFGRNPLVWAGAPHFRPDEDFDEIWWRMLVRHEEGWSTTTHPLLTQVLSFTNTEWGSAAHGVAGPGDAAGIELEAYSCVYDGAVPCQAFNDESWQYEIDWAVGEPIFDDVGDGHWRCVEAHARLNTPGATDGVFELYVDESLAVELTGLDWRGTWTGTAWNGLLFENWWGDGAEAPLERWIDDIAVATERVGCE